MGKEIVDMRIDRRAIALCFLYGGARDQSTEVAPVHVAGRVVVRIEKIGVLRNFGAISGNESFQNKRFEEPGGVGKVPFGWADIRYRLDNTILGLKIRAQSCREVSDLAKTREQIFGTRSAPVRTRPCGRCLIDSGRGD